MTSGKVLKWVPKKFRGTLSGFVIDTSGAPHKDVVLLVGDFELGRTIAEPGPKLGAGRYDFRFLLDRRLTSLLAVEHDLRVECDGRRLDVSPAVAAVMAQTPPNPARLDIVRSELAKGYVLTTRGGIAPPFNDSPNALKRTLRHYERCSEIVDGIVGCPLYVVGGSFLGVLREGGAIAHDFDVDTAFLSPHTDPAEVKADYKRLIYALLDRGEAIRFVTRGKQRLRRNYFMWLSPRVPKRGKVRPQIDVFPAYIDAEGFYCRPTFVRIPGGRAMIEPLKRRPFGAHSVWSPSDMVAKAERIFGPNWRTPDPFWRKPKFPGAKRAIAALELSDAELREIALRMADDHGRQILQLLGHEDTPEPESPTGSVGAE